MRGAHHSIQALGRLKTGQMNRTEEAYAAFLETLKACGDVLWYRFEGVKLRLADSTFYSPDFAVMRSTGALEMHEVKGFWTDDARVKIKVAADAYPFEFMAMTALPKKQGGGWKTRAVLSLHLLKQFPRGFRFRRHEDNLREGAYYIVR